MANSEIQVILVDEKDQQIGLLEKMKAHELGVLHRAFSIFLFNDEGQMLIHRRADDKYHSGGLWTNACCSHPFENEKIENAAHRRLKEELGIESELTKAFDFIYKAKLENGLEEHEYDHVLLGNHNGPVYPDLSEVAEWKFADLAWIDQRTTQSPHEFTPWFIIALPKVLSFLKSKQLQQ